MYWAMIAPHPRANTAVSRFLGVPLCELWPQWFDREGKLISRQALPRSTPEPISLRTHASRAARRVA
jgi:hypothetical protein